MRRLLCLGGLALLACGGSRGGGGDDGVQGGADGGGGLGADGGGVTSSSGGDGGAHKDGAVGADSGGSGKGGADSGTPSRDSGTTASGDSGAATSASKRGVAYGSNSSADLGALSAGISWWYNWSPQQDSTLNGAAPPSGVEFVPMVWGGTFDVTTLGKQIPAGTQYLLTFNEPNFGSQSNLTPQAAAALWPQIQTFAQSRGMKIVSPALNYCGGSCNETSPFDWLDAFFAACQGCQVDYIGAHWYACSKSALTGYLQEYETKYGKPLWVTEFSCLDNVTPTVAIESSYMDDALSALEADPMVFRYSWFTGRDTSQTAINLLGASGQLTTLGQQYVAYPH